MKSYIKQFFLLWKHLKKRRKRQLILLLFLSLISAVCESISLASIFPFLNLIDNYNNPNFILFNNSFFELSNFSNQNLFNLSIVFFIVAIFISGLIRILTIYLSLKLSAVIGNDLSTKIYRNILNLDYEEHIFLDNNKTVVTLTEHLRKTQRIIDSLLTVLTSSLIAISIFIFLFVIDSKALIIILVVFGSSYLLINYFNNNKIHIISHRIVSKLNLHIKSIRESLIMIREIKSFNLNDRYQKNHNEIDKSLRIALANTAFFAQYPRYMLEIVGFISIAIIALVTKSIPNQNINLLTTLGGFALACQRVLPILQLIYAGIVKIKTHKPSLIEVIYILEKRKKSIPNNADIDNESKLVFKNEINFQNVSFSYKNSKTQLLKKINLKIKKGERIGLIGKSGSGKSTLIYLLLGLLKPTRGKIFIDNFLFDNLKSNKFNNKSHSLISYVPQDIYIIEGTFLENIAYGSEKKYINSELVKECAKKAQLSDLIEKFTLKYDYFINENGKNLSGGQKQRLGIARALYQKPEILILDEATNALDQQTLLDIKNTIDNLPKDLTIIIISHQLDTLSFCDRTISIENGTIQN